MTARPPKFTSYSANFEDVILNRLFAGRESGFFVDVGAAHPKMENDCKALYDRGWRGINIEPNPRFFEELQAQRPGDVSLRVAIDETDTIRAYYWIDGSGLSTLDEDEARRCEQQGWVVQRLEIRTASLGQILHTHAGAHVDLLKIDVEGWEEVVLRSNDWARFIPSVIMVEATLPERAQRRETGIEAFLAEKGYTRAYFDGLNDFYTHRDFAAPDHAFAVPPNVFDNFESYLLVEAREHTANLQAAFDSAARFSEAEKDALDDKDRELAHVRALLQAETDRVAEIGAVQQAGALQIMKLDSALRDALEAQGRAHHDAVRRASDVERLQASLATLQADCLLYARRAEDSHAEREELLQLRAAAHALATQPAAEPAAPAPIPAPISAPVPAAAVAEAAPVPSVDLAPWRNEIARLQGDLDVRTFERDDARAWLAAIRGSSSWRLTRPLRAAAGAVKSRAHKPPSL